ncbi:type III-B CRISPR module-associated Cmr3 family protein [Stygiolobus caldivivus]|uniref:Uncharacterized protein n=1 Tax=Stygiolobus caldivivus TaxID=2824673 RepID=A0A8D5U733_9CREN|nr:type III-B CRISPR module-associated Cmr3 family protein [Stygiolobus caldivivus]BCU70041.1 hypothetical protein KN1_13380 [Stygiolobus caldivivus]
MGLLVKPLEPVLFRWHGEYSPSLSGPMNKGVSEPLPLISTITGALYRSLKGGSYVRDEEKLAEEFKAVLGDVWGPVVFVEGKRRGCRSAAGKFVLFHDYPGRLGVLRLDGDTLVTVYREKEKDYIVPEQVNRTGIGRDLAKRNAKEHLLYSVKLVDLGSTVLKNFEDVKEWGIYVKTDAKYRGVVRLGGRGRTAAVKELDLDLPNKGEKSVVASPVLLDSDKRSIVTVDDLMEMRVEGVALANVLEYGKIGVVGRGYSLSYNSRRPLYPALLPGSVLNRTDREKVGLFKELGWGSLLRFSSPPQG